MRKIFILISLMLSFLLFTGCQQKSEDIKIDDYILLNIDISESGRVVQELEFSVGSIKLSSLGKSELEKQNFIVRLIDEVDELRTEFLLSYTLKYIKNPVEEFKLGRGLLLSQVTYRDKTDSVGFNIIFADNSAWQYYNSQTTDDEKPEQGSDNKNLFVTKSSSVGLFPFAAKWQEETTIGQRYENKYLAAASELNLDSDFYNPVFIYDYSTFYSSLRSDANQLIKDGGQYHHVWIRPSSQLSDNSKINLSVTIINRWVWYATALIITLLGTIIALAIVKLKAKRNNKRKLTTNKKA